MSLGTKIRKARIRKGLGLAEAADAVGVAKSVLWSWEKDKYRPRIPKLRLVARTFDVPFDQLFAAFVRELAA